MKGHMQDGKFHPHIPHQKGVRKKRSISTVDGIKIINNTKGKDVLIGVKRSLREQPKSVRNKIHTILIKDKDPDEDFVARTNTTNGDMIFNKKPELGEKEYEALGVHEFEHIDFNNELEKGNPKYEEFIKQGNTIRPFTPDLIATKFEQDSAFIEGNFGILPDKRLEYPDEINSVVKEIETRERLGLPTRVLDEEQFRLAKKLVDNLHRKKRDVFNDDIPSPISIDRRFPFRIEKDKRFGNQITTVRPKLGESIKLLEEVDADRIVDTRSGETLTKQDIEEQRKEFKKRDTD